MAILSSMRRQNAIYWPPAPADSFGRPGFGALVPLIAISGGANSRVRWEDKNENFRTAQGTDAQSAAIINVPAIPGGEMVVGGWLWLGDRGGLSDEVTPTNNAGAYEIRRFDKLPNFKATDCLRTAYV